MPETDGSPTDLVRRRWRRFGVSGAKLVWGGEAVAVAPEGRANPHQLVIHESNVEALSALRGDLVDAHRVAHGRVDDLLVGLQLTHSGRWCRPTGPLEPKVAQHHPVLDRRAPGEVHVLTDGELDGLVEQFVTAARHAPRCRVLLRRREALPRLSAARAPGRHRSAGRVRRAVRTPDGVPAPSRRRHPDARSRAGRRSPPLGV